MQWGGWLRAPVRLRCRNHDYSGSSRTWEQLDSGLSRLLESCASTREARSCNGGGWLRAPVRPRCHNHEIDPAAASLDVLSSKHIGNVSTIVTVICTGYRNHTLAADNFNMVSKIPIRTVTSVGIPYTRSIVKATGEL